MNIGHAIKTLRKKAEISQKDFSKLARISQTYLSEIENEKKLPSIPVLINIGDALNVPMFYLIWIASNENDVEDDKRDKYNYVYPMVTGIMDSLI